MLKLVKIKKDYVTKGVPTVHALKGLTVNFRRNEFVAILGASGCGKTTLLNIVGGLDRYTSGDLIIEGKSTKHYTDRDWDTYRNHSIGFVFQSYNLISHQSVLKNVELALTISGIGREERKQRALRVIETVGLSGMEKKKPNQLSGGQMQRVAIARALVNDPEILLADEPTGALDSETSVQIMDLLKEVASDRLVIMVTHNPDLANTYATRIVTMKDGLITGDSNPYEGEKKEELKVALDAKNVNKGNKKKTSMSFFTATGLSFANLISKLKRTILISIAGSIGIIGVSSVLAVSTGVNNYFKSMQDDMISRYPLEVAESGINFSTLMSGLSEDDKREIAKFDLKTQVGVDSMINYLMKKYKDVRNAFSTNEINEELISFIYGAPEEAVASINEEYGLDMTNNIYTKWKRHNDDPDSSSSFMSLNGLTQMYISELETVEDFAQYSTFVDLFTNFMTQTPGDKEYILSQYDLLGNSKYPEKPNEILLVVDENQTLTDLMYAQLGFYTQDQFLNIAKKAIEMQKDNPDPAKIEELSDPDSERFDIDRILNHEFKYYPSKDMWKYRTDLTQTSATLNVPLKIGDEDKISIAGSLIANKETQSIQSTMAIMYDGSIATGAQCILKYNDTNPYDPDKPFQGTWSFPKAFVNTFSDFLEEKDLDRVKSLTLQLDLTKELSIPPSTTFQYGEAVLSATDLDGNESVISADTIGRDLTIMDMMNQSALASYPFYFPSESNIESYMYPAKADDSWTDGIDVKISGILKKKKGIEFGCLDRGVYYTKELSKIMMDDANDEANGIVNDATHGLKTYIGSPDEKNAAFTAYVTYEYSSFLNGDNGEDGIQGFRTALNGDLSSSISSMLSLTGGGSGNQSTDAGYLRSLSGLKTTGDKGIYTFERLPQSIQIYPKSFAAKKQVTKYLDQWNKEGPLDVKMRDSGETVTLQKDDRHELSYNDPVELIVTIINTLITVVTVALVAFTSLSLIVSCFMIAVITYISTMERVKEIGIIRSLGGRKKDVSRLFIAECLVLGLSSGLFGVLITYGLAGIFNLIMITLHMPAIANLTIITALIMVSISVLLNVLSGLIPALRASSQDPVVALRTE